MTAFFVWYVIPVLLYFVIGFVVLGWHVARNNDEVTVSEFLVLLFIWPPVAVIVYIGWLADSGIGRRRATVYLHKIFGGGAK